MKHCIKLMVKNANCDSKKRGIRKLIGGDKESHQEHKKAWTRKEARGGDC